MLRVVLVSFLALVAEPAAFAEKAHVGYPNSIVALGDSDSTGFDSQIPGRDAPRNSWSSGDNPAVQSQYLRILAANAKIKGNNYMYARDGSGTDDLVRQVLASAQLHPDYYTIETGGNDMCANPSIPLDRFRAHFAAGLAEIGKVAPNARIFVTSIPWFNATFDAVFGPWIVAHGYSSDNEPCDPAFDANGVPNAAREATMAKLRDAYNGALGDVCAQFVHCRYDGGVLSALEPVMSDFSFLSPTDVWAYTHPSVQGHAKMATASWPATFDFTDRVAPASHASRTGTRVALAATDNAGVSGIEYRLKPTGPWIRYSAPVTVRKAKTLTWRAVDVNGNCEATHSLKG